MTPVSKIKDMTRVAEKALVSSASRIIYTMLIVRFPFLAWPVLRNVFGYILDSTLFWLSEQGIILFNDVWVRFMVSGEAADLEDARKKAVEAVNNDASDEELDKIDKEMSDAFDKLVRIGRNPL